MIKIYRTNKMAVPPRRGQGFRVGKYVGQCILRLPGLVVMRCY